MAGSLPSHARVVVIGGGIAGCSVAYHLTKLGWRDVLLLERRDISCGTTWHAAGLVGQLRATQNLTRLAKYGGDPVCELKGTLAGGRCGVERKVDGGQVLRLLRRYGSPLRTRIHHFHPL